MRRKDVGTRRTRRRGKGTQEEWLLLAIIMGDIIRNTLGICFGTTSLPPDMHCFVRGGCRVETSYIEIVYFMFCACDAVNVHC